MIKVKYIFFVDIRNQGHDEEVERQPPVSLLLWRDYAFFAWFLKRVSFW